MCSHLNFILIRGFFLWVSFIINSECRSSKYSCDFEDHDGCHCAWLTTDNDLFMMTPEDERYRLPTITPGTTSGQFIMAKGDNAQNPEAYMHSKCFVTETPNCFLRFHYLASPKLPSGDHPYIMVQLLDGCEHDVHLHMRIYKQKQIFGDGNWNMVEFDIGNETNEFQIIISAYLPGFKSYVAMDDFEFLNCTRELPNGQCGEGEFRCINSDCVSPDKLCNIQPDCSCAEDEILHECRRIPLYGRMTFDNCSFDTGGCGWYNVLDDDFDWQLENDEEEPYRKMADHSTRIGRFLSINNTEHLEAKSTAILRSVEILPPPPSGQCWFRFFIHLTDGSLEVDVESQEVKGQRKKNVLWRSSEHLNKKYQWQYVVISLTNITENYFLQFRAYKTTGNDTCVYLDDVSLSFGCFPPKEEIDFKTCGTKGPNGPTQAQCDAEYSGTTAEGVKVIEEGDFIGAQIWVVPETGTYSITASGAHGGLGMFSRSWKAVGGFTHGKFELEKDEQIYIVVGQEGGSTVCNEQTNSSFNGCLLYSKYVKNDNFSYPYKGGGGGGGGATYVFKVNGSEVDLLLVAGGGGGLGAVFRGEDDSTSGGLTVGGSGESGWTPLHSIGAGGGAGWKGVKKSPQTGQSLLDDMKGGQPCHIKGSRFQWSGYGGFGGGGGACAAGGGGGGYSGGDAPADNNATLNGQAGSSYIHPDAMDTEIDTGHTLEADGFVQISPQHGCPCSDICIWIDYSANKYKCQCLDPFTLKDNGECLSKNKKSSFMIAVVVSSAVIALIVAFIGVCVCGWKFSNLKTFHQGIISLDKIVSYCQPKSLRAHQRVRQSTQRPTSMMEFNPSYDSVSPKNFDHSLMQVPRKYIKLIKPLGHGAFGEVCEGTLSCANSNIPEVRIAVKTLLPLCTEQTELDFLMEAIIVSRFSHPNIVRFLGVCFEQRPKLIVLELLEGGDLKSFLRESRPKSGEPSNLTVADLLRLSLDVAKGCQHLEEKHFIHRDIATRNCLLTTKNSNRVAKIADFGMARDIYSSDYYKKSGNALLPVKWMPPEAFLDGIFTIKTDVWSFGVLLWEVFSLGYMPYPGCSNEEVVHFVTVGGRLDAPDSCPSSVYDIMASCWSGIAEERPPFSLIVSSLENCLQDQSLSSNLPIIYLPNVYTARSFKFPQTVKSGTKPNSEGCLDPLLPSWLSNARAEGCPINDEDLSDEEGRSVQRPKYDKDLSKHTKKSTPKKKLSGQLHKPPSEIPLLTVEDFQELFENEVPKQADLNSSY